MGFLEEHSTLLGGTAGSLLGATAGYMLTGSKRNAVIGGLVGGAGGALAGSQIGPEKELAGDMQAGLAKSDAQRQPDNPSELGKHVGAATDEYRDYASAHPNYLGAAAAGATLVGAAKYGPRIGKAVTGLRVALRKNKLRGRTGLILSGLAILAAGVGVPAVSRRYGDTPEVDAQKQLHQEWERRNGIK